MKRRFMLLLALGLCLALVVFVRPSTLLVKEESFNSAGEPGSWITYKYDLRGNRTAALHYNRAGKELARWEYAYDGENRMIHAWQYSGKRLVRDYEYRYEGGRVVEQIINPTEDGAERYSVLWEYSDDGVLRCSYRMRDGEKLLANVESLDAAGRMLTYETYGSDGSLFSWGERSYDEAGNKLTDKMSFDSDGVASVYTRFKNSYDESGRLLRAETFNSEDEYRGYVVYEYRRFPLLFQQGETQGIS